jgi:hypothetical protein
MPWFDLAEELAQTISAPEWGSGTDVSTLRDHLFRELGMVEVPPEFPGQEEGLDLGSSHRNGER